MALLVTQKWHTKHTKFHRGKWYSDFRHINVRPVLLSFVCSKNPRL